MHLETGTLVLNGELRSCSPPQSSFFFCRCESRNLYHALDDVFLSKLLEKECICWVPLTSLRLSEISFKCIDYGQALPMWFWALHLQENVLSPRQGFCSITVVPKGLGEEKNFRQI